MWRSPDTRARAWFASLLIASVALQASTTLVRPMLSYRALEIGLGPALLGIVAAAFAIAPLAVAVRLGRLVDRGHETRYALAGAIAIAGASVFVAWSGSLAALLAGSAVLGLGHLATVVAMQTLVASRSDDGRLDRRFGHVAFAASFGQLIGPALAGAAAADGTPAGTSRALVVGAGVALVALPFVLGMRAGQRPREPRAGDDGPVPLGALLRSPGLASTMLASLTVLAAVDMLMVYLPALGEEMGWGPSTVGALLAIRAGASMISRLGLGRLVDTFGRRSLLLGSMAVSAAMIAVLPAAGTVAAAAVVIAVAGFALGLGQPLTVSSVATQADPSARATALSIRMMGNRFGQVVVPVAAGAVGGLAGAGGVLTMTGLAVAASTAAVAGGTSLAGRRRRTEAARAEVREP